MAFLDAVKPAKILPIGPFLIPAGKAVRPRLLTEALHRMSQTVITS